MKQFTIKNILFFSLLVIYCYLFWKQSLGINIAIFSLLVTGVLFYLNPTAWHSKPAIFTSAGLVVCAVFSVIHHTDISLFMLFVSVFLAAGFIQMANTNYIPFNILQTFHSYLNVPRVWMEAISSATSKHKQFSLTWRYVQRGIIPTAVFFVFYFIYWNANPIFGKMANMFTDKIFLFFNEIFKYISLPFFFFLLFGAVLLTGLIYYRFNKILLQSEALLPEFLRRKTKRFPKVQRPQYYVVYEPNPIGLKNEAKSALWLLILVNALLLILNCIDISWVWFGFNMPENFNLKQFVHEGTYLLIISILLSIGLLLFYFRGNLNFYKQSILLKNLAYIWIFQNMVLAVSVFLRNWHYIQFHGLAYKRIGVIVFLLLTIIGLYTLYVKIRHNKTYFYLLRTNAWTIYAVLVMVCFIHWDKLIVNYNLNHWNTAGIDTDFYYQLSAATYPIIYQHLDKVENQMNGQRSLPEPWAYRTDIYRFKDYLKQKSNDHISNEEGKNWQSWNYTDARAAAQLKEIYLKK